MEIMKTHLTLAAALAVGATGAYAGGMDRSGQSIAPIFEDGSYVELSFGSVSPTVSGTIGAGTVPSNDMAKSYLQLGAAYKRDLNDKLSMAVIFDQPYGADVDYGAASGSYPFVGSTATVDTNAVTGILRYKLSDRFAVHGGVRILQSSGEVAIPFYSYTMSTSTETDASYLIGASYEIPDIALRAALTYHSETDITFDTTENGSASGNMVVTMPQTVNLDFQTGIAADTLLMASVRWLNGQPQTFRQMASRWRHPVGHWWTMKTTLIHIRLASAAVFPKNCPAPQRLAMREPLALRWATSAQPMVTHPLASA